jgi:hypothetical protein
MCKAQDAIATNSLKKNFPLFLPKSFFRVSIFQYKLQFLINIYYRVSQKIVLCVFWRKMFKNRMKITLVGYF